MYLLWDPARNQTSPNHSLAGQLFILLVEYPSRTMGKRKSPFPTSATIFPVCPRYRQIEGRMDPLFSLLHLNPCFLHSISSSFLVYPLVLIEHILQQLSEKGEVNVLIKCMSEYSLYSKLIHSLYSCRILSWKMFSLKNFKVFIVFQLLILLLTSLKSF